MSGIAFSRNVSVTCIHEHREIIDSLSPFLKKVAPLLGGSAEDERKLRQLMADHAEESRYFDFDPERITETFALKEAYLFPEAAPIRQVILRRFSAVTHKTESMVSIDLEPDAQHEMADVASLLRACVGAPSYRDDPSNEVQRPIDPEVIENLLSQGIVTRQREAWPDLNDFEGVLRLQHASLLFRSGGKGLLVDPHLHTSYGSTSSTDNVLANDIIPFVDAIALSHSHLDHYNLATLMMFPLDTLIIVPKVSKLSIICDDMRERLASIGFTNVHDVEWYGEPVTLGDMQVQVVPFYGEQPLRYEAPFDDDLRNWGSTFIVRTPVFSMWLLVDSGDDALGAMLDVARDVRERYGAVDIISSNLGVFAPFRPTYVMGSHEYWLSLSPDQRARFSSMRRHKLTLGHDGVADICTTVGARYFLPYAHWWGDYGTHPRGEVEDVRRLDDALKNLAASTSIIRWAVGDRFSMRGETYETQPHLR